MDTETKTVSSPEWAAWPVGTISGVYFYSTLQCFCLRFPQFALWNLEQIFGEPTALPIGD